MLTSFFEENIITIFFFYGLAFFSMGIAIWGESTIQPPTPTFYCLYNGDVDGNGSVTAGDAQLAFQIVLGVYTPNPQEECAADCNGSGTITAGDSQQIFGTALGLDSCVDPI